MRRYTNPSRVVRGGFTLVELITVTAVLAVLAGVLLPTLGAARARARQADCMAHLHQIGLAFHMYTDDYGTRPLRLHNLWPQYVSDSRVFVCPDDAWTDQGGWAWSAWGRSGTPPEKWPFPISYGYFFAPDLQDPWWRLAQEAPGRPGYVVCVLHGTPRLSLMPSAQAPYFSGRTVRLCFSGAVIALDVRYSKGIFSTWKLMTDQDYAPGQPHGSGP